MGFRLSLSVIHRSLRVDKIHKKVIYFLEFKLSSKCYKCCQEFQSYDTAEKIWRIPALYLQCKTFPLTNQMALNVYKYEEME